MRHFIIATHGTFAEGIYESIKIIIGSQENIHIINGFVESNDIESIVKETINSIPNEAEIIVCTDIFGGSVNNEFMKYVGKPNFYLVTGINLPFLMQMFLSVESDTKDMLRKITDNKETAPVFCNDLFAEESEEEDF